jgi:hypothetical protein
MPSPNRSGMRTVANAGLLLAAIAMGAHFVWGLLGPILPGLIALSFAGSLIYLFIRRRS